MDNSVRVDAEPTPNPNAYKLTVNRQVSGSRGETFNDLAEAFASPLAQRLFNVEGVRRLFFLGDFITITRESTADWDRILERAEQEILAHFGAEPAAR